MKKLLSLLALAAVMCVGMAGNALAYFETGHLIRVVYQDTGSVEVLTDLGAVDFATITNGTVGTGADAFNLGQFSGSSYSDLNVAYYLATGTLSTSPVYLSGEMTTAPVTPGRKGNSLMGPLNSVRSVYQGAGTATVVGSKTTGYYNYLDTAGNVGKFNSFYGATGYGEADLAALATVGYVDQKIYYFATPNSGSAVAGVEVAIIRTMADGTTIINPSAVPIPGAALLFGSGLLGLFGIRRKNA